ncbi:MAG: arylesterase [Cellvibrionales bacterium]|nr:arylesterase [Cellvibrionales bacterium]
MSISFVTVVFAKGVSLDEKKPPFTTKTLLIFGDSLSAGYGLDRGEDWPSLIKQKLDADKKFDYRVINQSISGEITQGGALRLPRALVKYSPDVVVIALGANDGLRGLSIKKMKANLIKMIRLAKQHQTKILLVGMKIPPNYGKRYTQHFENAFREVSEQEKVALLPFLLDGVAQDSRLFQKDQLHPIDKAQPIIMKLVYKHLEPLL